MTQGIINNLKAHPVAVAIGVVLLVAIVANANRYAVLQESNAAAVGIWVVDRFTGDVEYCSPGGGCTDVRQTE